MKVSNIIVAIMIVFVLSISYSQNANATSNSREIIKEYVEAMDEQNWDDFLSLYCEEEQGSLRKFFLNSHNHENHIGVLNVKSASLKEIVEINIEDAKNMLYKDYTNKQVKVYVYGVDFKVYSDDKYFSSGTNYNYITLVMEDNKWKISEMIGISEPQKLLDLGYRFTNKYNQTINVMKARKNGHYINFDGAEFASIKDNSLISPASVINNWTVPSDYTPVRLKTSDGSIQTLSFHNYCLGVVAGETEYSDLDGEVRKAQSIATKTFTWHFIIVPKEPVEGYDLNYQQQSYRPERIANNAQITIDYNSVKGIWMESYSGAIFEAFYGDGDYASHTRDPKGRFLQWGAKWLKDNNIATTYRAMLKYYYDNTNASSGGPIRFFDSMKNEL